MLVTELYHNKRQVNLMKPSRRISTDRSDGVTRYLQLYEMLSRSLADGAFKTALPSEPELTKSYNVSRTTVRRALERLEEEGRISRRRGSGTYPVAGRVRRSGGMTSENILGDLLGGSKGCELVLKSHVATSLTSFLANAYPELAEQEMLSIHRVRAEEGRPCFTAITYMPRAVIRELGLVAGNGVTEHGLRKLARAVRTVDRETVAIAADSIAARALRIRVGAPLLRIRAALRDARGQLLGVDECVMRSDGGHLADRICREKPRVPGLGSWTRLAA